MDAVTLAMIKALGGSGGGSSGGVLVVNDVDGTLDKTWQDIHDADFAVLKTVAELPGGAFVVEYNSLEAVSHTGTDYYVSFGGNEYITDSVDGYPTAS